VLIIVGDAANYARVRYACLLSELRIWPWSFDVCGRVGQAFGRTLPLITLKSDFRAAFLRGQTQDQAQLFGGLVPPERYTLCQQELVKEIPPVKVRGMVAALYLLLGITRKCRVELCSCCSF